MYIETNQVLVVETYRSVKILPFCLLGHQNSPYLIFYHVPGKSYAGTSALSTLYEGLLLLRL